ncbi:Lrp/AsnC family transcriptional regulator [uncultured Boseongicola sp.]|jgi:Lrp/AsnC family transcriptional regulator|uniref:Lrp/AsnC family transcriptional regulator n=1 Tax=uncultured Boseongicola sp. TaxID=1648499 RepID=UPI0026287DD1|nr:Lrp/AsnC family transcriptional regulator [uncultured Boseongicola sp.]
MLDDTDRRLLRQLLADPGAATAVLAERSGMTQASCWRRLEKLTDTGIIRGRHAVVDWPALGYEVEVSLRITLEKNDPRAFDHFIFAARKVPEVTEIQTFLGRVDVRVVVIARDMAHYQSIYREQILTLPHIADLEALMTVATVKTNPSLPL